jgi:hypothetical protein
MQGGPCAAGLGDALGEHVWFGLTRPTTTRARAGGRGGADGRLGLPGLRDRGGRAALAAAPPAAAPQRRTAQAPGAGALVAHVVLPFMPGRVQRMG